MDFPMPLASHDHHAFQVPYAGPGADDTDAGFINANSVGVAPLPLPGVGAAAAASEATSATLQNQLYLLQAGNASATAYTDLHQGGIGDCYLLSSIGEVALQSPSFIHNMITANPDGTETVRLYEAADGQLPGFSTTSFKPVSETVSNVFDPKSVNSQPGQDSQGSVHEIWPQVLEKAMAQLSGGYGSIDHGGWPALAMEELTGQKASLMSLADVTAPMLQADISAHDLAVLDTTTADPTYNVVGGHAYMITGLVNGSAGPEVACANPWGFDQPSLVPVSQLSHVFSGINVGMV